MEPSAIATPSTELTGEGVVTDASEEILPSTELALIQPAVPLIRLRATITNLACLLVSACITCPSVAYVVSALFRLVFGTLYPAYASYKAVRTKNVKEYVKWMMYWIVFALFTCAETFTDIFFSFWFPFYYEIKIILVLWLLSPATSGSSILYRKFVHPALTRREREIDDFIERAKEQGYHTILQLGSKGINYATQVLMQTAIKGGGGLVNHLKKSYSLSDLALEKEGVADFNRNSKALPNIPDVDGEEVDGTEEIEETNIAYERRRRYSPRRSASGSGHMEMYFPEVDVDVRQRTTRSREQSISHIRSSEDVSSGYSSSDPLYGPAGAASRELPLVRTASMGSTRARARGSKGASSASSSTVVGRRGTQGEGEDVDESNESLPSLVSCVSIEAATSEDVSIIDEDDPVYGVGVSTCLPIVEEPCENTSLEMCNRANEPQLPAVVVAVTTEAANTEEKTNESVTKNLKRSGRYKKLPAPLPPSCETSADSCPENRTDSTSCAVQGRLVLHPEVVKALSDSRSDSSIPIDELQTKNLQKRTPPKEVNKKCRTEDVNEPSSRNAFRRADNHSSPLSSFFFPNWSMGKQKSKSRSPTPSTEQLTSKGTGSQNLPTHDETGGISKDV